jgi:hypothetical protein
MSNETCALCGHFKMKEYPEHAKVGLGRCAGRGIGPINEIKPFLPWSRPACERYTPALNLADREAWIEKRRALDQKNNAAQPETKG